MGARRIEISEAVLPKDALQVTLTEHDDVVDTLATNATEKPLAAGVGAHRQMHPMRAKRRDVSLSRMRSIHCTAASGTSSRTEAPGERIAFTSTTTMGGSARCRRLGRVLPLPIR
jgi:hypothetical protein